ncbi:MAG: acyl carrier protein [Salinivirgaceae bacterium]|jgi:acyl carrier protein
MEAFIKKLEGILEVDKIEMDDVLLDFEEWDSLTSLSIIATIDADFHFSITAEELLSAGTVGNLIKLIQVKSKK